MEALESLQARKSIRSYTSEAPTREQLEQIVDIAQHAPNAGPFSTTVITDPALLAEIDETIYQSMMASEGFGRDRASTPGYRPLYGAPALIIFSAVEDNLFAKANTACACTAGTYAATALGLGSCYVMGPALAFEADKSLGAKLQLPEGHAPYCGLLVGHTNDPEIFSHKFTDQAPAVFI